MRRISVVILLASAAICLAPDISEGGIIFGRRRTRAVDCCYTPPVAVAGCCGVAVPGAPIGGVMVQGGVAPAGYLGAPGTSSSGGAPMPAAGGGVGVSVPGTTIGAGATATPGGVGAGATVPGAGAGAGATPPTPPKPDK